MSAFDPNDVRKACLLYTSLLSQMETENSFGGSTTEANKITVDVYKRQGPNRQRGSLVILEPLISPCSQPMFIAPLGNGLGEFLVEVRRLCGGLGHHFEDSRRLAADSTSA